MNPEEKAEFKAVYSTLGKTKKKSIFIFFRNIKSRTATNGAGPLGRGERRQRSKWNPAPPRSQLLVQQNGLLKTGVIPLHGLPPSSSTCLHTQNPPSSQLVSRDGLLGAWRAYRCWDLTIKNSVDCSPPSSSVPGILQIPYLSGLPCPAPGDLPDPGIKPTSPALQVDSSLMSHEGSPYLFYT